MPVPVNWEPVPVAGKYVYSDGTPASGTVTFTIPSYLRDPDADTVILPTPKQFILDVNGEFSGTLLATDDPDIDPNFYYTVTEVMGGVTTTFLMLVPKDQVGTLQMADVDRNATIPPEPEVYTRTINGMWGDVYLPDDLGMTPSSRIIATGTGLTGGGNLTADRTLSVVTDSTVQKSEYADAGTLIATRKRLNFIDGGGITATVTDNSGQNRADVTFGSSGLMTTNGTVNSISAGLRSARPAAGTGNRLYLSTDLKQVEYDNGTDWIPNDQMPPVPKSWTAIGHSYLQFTAGSFNQRSRLDSIIKNRWGAESSNWVNMAVAGSRAAFQGASFGGWATMWREINKLPGKTAPYTNSDGGLLIVTGINDLGNGAGANAQGQTAWGHAMRSMISRWRASTIKEDTDASVGYTGSWSNGTDIDHASNGTFKFRAGAVTGDVVTITLPADYDGSPVAVCWMGRPGTNGGTITLGGTALASKPENGQTILTNDIMPALSFSHVPVTKRITSLTSANAGQTITMTVTVNANEVQFDCWWIEAKEAPPVIVANVAKLTASGYSTKYPSWNAAPANGSCDADVNAYNTVLTNVVAEFDGMVQIADIDSALNKDATLFFDGLHPNELGAAKCADAIDDARRKLMLTGRKSASLNFNMAPRYGGGIRRRRTSGIYHTADFTTQTTYNLVAGDMFALPFEITEGDEQYTRWALEKTAVGTGSPTIRWCVFSDYMNKGYPDLNLQELTFAGALTLTAATGVQLNPAAQFTWWPDIGMYYYVIKIETIGTGTWTLAALNGPSPMMPAATTAGAITTANTTKGVAWKLTGQAAGAFPSTFPSGATPATIAPYVGSLKT